MALNNEVLCHILPHRPNRNIFVFFLYILQHNHYKSIEMTHFYIGNLLQTTQNCHFSHFFWPHRPPTCPSQRSELQHRYPEITVEGECCAGSLLKYKGGQRGINFYYILSHARNWVRWTVRKFVSSFLKVKNTVQIDSLHVFLLVLRPFSLQSYAFTQPSRQTLHELVDFRLCRGGPSLPYVAARTAQLPAGL